MKRLLMFVHYNKNNNLEDYVIYMLENIKTIFKKVIFISNSLLYKDNLKKISGLYDKLITRENIGFDFGAWKEAIIQESWEELSGYDNITLINDSCFGPLYDLSEVYNYFEKQNIDFFGLTDYSRMEYGMPITNGPIPQHIQSYFMCFKNNIIKSIVFKKFWDNVINEENVELVIQKYETQLTLILKENGFLCSSYIESKDLVNISFNRPDLCINNKIPLLKIKSFNDYKYPYFIQKLINSKSGYPYQLINKYIVNNYDPQINFNYSDKTFNSLSLFEYNEIENKSNIAIHINVIYLNVFNKYIEIFNKINIEFDLYITTNTLENKNEIENILNGCSNNYKLIYISIEYENDIINLINLDNYLNKYDIVGNFNMNNGFNGLDNYFNLLLYPMELIIKLFNSDKNIGIVFPDLPDNYIENNSKNLIKKTNMFWNKLKINRELNIDNKFPLLYPYDKMFWYRPGSINKYLNKNNIQLLNTYNNVAERLIIYISWAEGYDYRISTYGMIHESNIYKEYIIFQNRNKIIFNIILLKIFKKIKNILKK